MLAKTWRNSYDSGIFIPLKMRFCNECTDILICNRCNNQINKNKELEAKIYFLKRQAPIQFVVMLPFQTLKDI